MAHKSFAVEDIIHKLGEADGLVDQGSMVAEAVQKVGVSRSTYYRWKKTYGGMRPSQVRQIKQLREENAQLRKLVNDLSFEYAVLRISRGSSGS